MLSNGFHLTIRCRYCSNRAKHKMCGKPFSGRFSSSFFSFSLCLFSYSIFYCLFLFLNAQRVYARIVLCYYYQRRRDPLCKLWLFFCISFSLYPTAEQKKIIYMMMVAHVILANKRKMSLSYQFGAVWLWLCRENMLLYIAFCTAHSNRKIEMYSTEMMDREMGRDRRVRRYGETKDESKLVATTHQHHSHNIHLTLVVLSLYIYNVQNRLRGIFLFCFALYPNPCHIFHVYVVYGAKLWALILHLEFCTVDKHLCIFTHLSHHHSPIQYSEKLCLVVVVLTRAHSTLTPYSPYMYTIEYIYIRADRW